MTQYMLAVHHRGGYPTASPEEMQEAFEAVDTFNAKVMAEGVWVFAGGLHEPSTATVVTSKDGDVTMTDGPFAEGKEVLGGFWIIEVPDLDVALSWAAEASAACREPVEVRPFQGEPEA